MPIIDAGGGHDIHPNANITRHRTVELRRAMQKRPETLIRVKRIMARYKQKAEPGTEESTCGHYPDPALHPNVGARTQILRENDPPEDRFGLIRIAVHPHHGSIH